MPQYVLFFKLGWIRTFNPIVIPGFFAGGAALIFLLRQFMLGLPKELDEAAMIDGANPLQVWWYVILPLCRPAIATITVFLFVGQWNNLVQPLIYFQRGELYTMPIYVAQKQFTEFAPALAGRDVGQRLVRDPGVGRVHVHPARLRRRHPDDRIERINRGAVDAQLSRPERPPKCWTGCAAGRCRRSACSPRISTRWRNSAA